MKEIGGYLEFEKFSGHEYYADLVSLNLARNALILLIRARNIKKVYFPYYVCNLERVICSQVKISYEYYHIDSQFRPILDETIPDDAYIYIVNFYGQLSDEYILQLHNKYQNIILDNVQAFFSRPLKGIDTIYSCRKYFGVPDGAYLSTDAEVDVPCEKDYSMDRMKHILGRFENESASAFYPLFKSSEEDFLDTPVKQMSKLTKNIMTVVDYEEISKKRNENWQILDLYLGPENQLELIRPFGPYMYPFMCENGAEIRSDLIKQKIYIPILWPETLVNDSNSLEKRMAKNILPLPLDQRYDIIDMEYILDKLLRCIGERK